MLLVEPRVLGGHGLVHETFVAPVRAAGLGSEGLPGAPREGTLLPRAPCLGGVLSMRLRGLCQPDLSCKQARPIWLERLLLQRRAPLLCLVGREYRNSCVCLRLPAWQRAGSQGAVQEVV